MAVIPAITIPNEDAADALEALERVWRNDAVRIFGRTEYEAMSGVQKAQACIKAMIRVRVRNLRKERAERDILTEEPLVN